MPEISVVIPLYNKGPYITRALNSVLAQTFQDFEVIVVEDTSIDDGVEAVRRFDDPRIRLIHQENQGVSAARNHGVAVAEGALIAFLDADDEWLPRHLEVIAGLHNNHPDAGLLATSYMIVNEGRTHYPGINGLPSDHWEGILPRYFKVAALSVMPIATSSVCIPKDIFREAGGFSVDVFFCEDSELWGKIALCYPIAYSWQIGAIYHKNENNITNNASDFPIHPFINTAENIIKENKHSQECLDDLQEYIARIKIEYAKNLLSQGNTKEANRILSSCETGLFIKEKIFWLSVSLIPRNILISILRIKHSLMR